MPILENAGCSLSYRVRGDGPPVLMIQGVGVHGPGWDPQTDELSGRFSCLSFDNRGMARSQPMGTEKLTVELMAEDALALADAQGWAGFHVVGHSMGGHVSLALARAHPHRVLSLALLCTAARGKSMPPMTPGFLWVSLRSSLGPRRRRRLAFLEMVLPHELREGGDLNRWAEQLEGIFGHDLADQPPVVSRQIRAYRAFDASPWLGTLGDIPTLVVSATQDPIAPPTLGSALAEEIPGSRYVEISGASHGVTVTHAADVNRLLVEHFDRSA